jgi:predicted RNase H-like HicB family nuclease
MRTFDSISVPRAGSAVAGLQLQANEADARTRQRASACATQRDAPGRWKLARATGTLFFLAALGAAVHADSGMTRAQVKAELAEAMRTGNILASGESGLTLRELNPQRYPAPVVAEGKTRAQVKTELAEAIRTGDIMANDESGLRVNEEYPQLYPAQVVAAGKTRAQVKAELAEAIRTGDMLANDESGLRLNEERPQRYAKARATNGDQSRLVAAEAPSASGGVTQ